MDIIKDCPECGKTLSRSKTYCSCGWKIVVLLENQIVDRRCAFITPKERCNNKGSIAPYGSNGKWYCGRHWYEAMNNFLKNTNEK